MLFNSFEFALFFPIVTMLFFMLPHKYRWFLLLAASCFFYMFFKPIYILILAFTIVVDYYVGIWLEREKEQKKKRQILVLSIIANVGILMVFKYYNFLAENLNLALQGLGKGELIPLLKILLPIGLSFHTFQAMSYTIEVYRGNQKAEKHFGIYALYVMFYPQLVAGPIERPQNVLHQFHEVKFFNYENARRGFILIAWGLFKKCVIADRLALFVNNAYCSPYQVEGISLILAVVFFAFQIYCDFSGYSDIAIGTAKVMGYDLMQNFNLPFAGKSVTEFWRRWHISLSTWFNDYLFIPIITAKRDWGKLAVAFGVFVTFFVSGFWHGAGWNFIIWGVLHAVAVIYEFYTKKIRKKIFGKFPIWLNNSLSIFFTFSYLCFTWIFFRIPTFGKAIYVLKHLFTSIPHQIKLIFGHDKMQRLYILYNSQTTLDFFLALLGISLIIFIHRVQKNITFDELICRQSIVVRWTLYFTLLIAFVLFGEFTKSEFIYFQF